MEGLERLKAWRGDDCAHVYLQRFGRLVVIDSLCKTGLDTLVAFGTHAAAKTTRRFGPHLLFGEPKLHFFEIAGTDFRRNNRHKRAGHSAITFGRDFLDRLPFLFTPGV